MHFSALFRCMAAFFVVCFLAAPAAAHLVAGRRPLDYFVRNADALLIATVRVGTSGRQDGHVTVFAPEKCLSGKCPATTFSATPRDDHVVTFSTGARTLVALRKAETKRAGGSQWHVLQNSWEAGLGAEYLARAMHYAPRYAALGLLPEAEREQAYLKLLLEQAIDDEPQIQDDALQSLLRFPAGHAGADGTRRLLRLASKASREAQQTAFVAIAQSWNEPAARAFIRHASDISSAWPAARARMLSVLADGAEPDRRRTCEHLDDKDFRVRAVAVRGCESPAQAIWPKLFEMLKADPSNRVRRAVKKRFKESPDARRWLVAEVRRELPIWRRWYYSATGKEASEVKEMLTE